MSEDGGKLADGPLRQALERDFGSVEALKTKFNATTAGIQGSGWGWLVSGSHSAGGVHGMGADALFFVGIQCHDEEARDCDDCEPGPVDLYVDRDGSWRG